MSKIERKLKERKNNMAIENAVKSEESIIYDSKYPLIIDNETIIREIEKIKEQTFEEGYSDGEYLDIPVDEYTGEVRITFLKKEYGDKMDFCCQITTELELDELEKKLLKCNSYEDIEMLQD